MNQTQPLEVSRTVLSREAYHRLRALIISGELQAGAQLVVRPLAEKFRLSPTPIKAALAALEREGLVEATPHRGFFVPQLGVKDVREIYALREVLDGLAARLTVENLNAGTSDTGVVEELSKLLESQRESVARGNLDAYRTLDAAFHRVLRRASRNERLVNTAESVHAQVDLLIVSSVRGPKRFGEVLAEHAAVLGAVKSGDAEGAEGAMRAHIRNAGDALLKHQQRASQEASRDSSP